MANILIVHAHHEPQSFSTALAKTAARTWESQGHQIVFSDLHAMGFNPVSDRSNFITIADPGYLKQQREEAYASQNAGFAPDLDAEMRKLESCDLLVFSFPLWWFGMPAILKGWVDRVFAYKRMYARGHWYENGVGQGKRAMALITTGSGAAMYTGESIHPSLNTILAPLHHGIFWFNGFSPLPPFVAWSAAHGTDADRHLMLDDLRARLQNIFEEPPLQLPHAADFDPDTFADKLTRFMVTLKQTHSADDRYHQLVPQQIAQFEGLRREGHIVSIHTAPWGAENWQGFLLFREVSQAAVEAACGKLVLRDYLNFEIARLAGGT